MERKYNNGEALPVETRVQIYEQWLDKYSHAVWDLKGFCRSTVYILMEELEVKVPVFIDEHPYLLPELYEFRTYRTQKDATEDRSNGYWYRNNEERIEALNKAIKLLTTKQTSHETTN